jgi:hypothetical protein
MKGRPRKIDYDAVLNLWKLGFTSKQIATLLHIAQPAVTNAVWRSRMEGDKRAVKRGSGRRTSWYELPDAVSA